MRVEKSYEKSSPDISNHASSEHKTCHLEQFSASPWPDKVWDDRTALIGLLQNVVV